MLGFRIKPQLNTSITQLAYKWINNYEIYGSNSLTPIVIKKKKTHKILILIVWAKCKNHI